MTALKISPALKKRAAQIKILLMDVDGTMTDGSVILLSQLDGTALEIKSFDAHDGQGLTLAATAGLRTGCITGRESSALLRRAQEMKMEFVYMKQPLKMPAYEDILRITGGSDAEVAYVGDDLPDIPLMRRAGLAVAVGDAVPTRSCPVCELSIRTWILGKRSRTMRWNSPALRSGSTGSRRRTASFPSCSRRRASASAPPLASCTRHRGRQSFSMSSARNLALELTTRTSIETRSSRRIVVEVRVAILIAYRGLKFEKFLNFASSGCS